MVTSTHANKAARAAEKTVARKGAQKSPPPTAARLPAYMQATPATPPAQDHAAQGSAPIGRPRVYVPSEDTATPMMRRASLEPAATTDLRRSPAAAASAVTEQRINAHRGTGRPMPSDVEAEMSARFQQDFSTVGILADTTAAELCAETGARAFTVGTDIFFAPGEFAPGTHAGRELLAHELTHVVQQQRGRLGRTGPGLQVSRSPLSDDLLDVLQTQGKGALFERLRQQQVSDPDVLMMVIFELAGDDLWLAHNLILHGAESHWPFHLQVEREMKGWSDCGGKGVVFEMLRAAAGAEAGNIDLFFTLMRLFAGDDLWLTANLQRHGPEANWPFHLRVEREMKGWSGCGGKNAVFGMLRAAAGAEAGNIDLFFTLMHLFAGDDLWLAANLQRHGPEASWPLHLRVEREMKGWSGCGGKGAVFTLLRADGAAHANDADLIATLAAIFPPGTDDAKLAVLLRKHGAETSWPVPVKEYQCPFDFAPRSSPGERILYNGEYRVVPAPDAHYHALIYTATNGTFDTAAGPTTKTFATGTAANRIDTGNVSFFIPAAFAAGATASVTMTLKQKSTGTVVMRSTWNYAPRSMAPTTIRQVQSNSAVPIGSAYDYNLGPALPAPATAPFYQHQTVLEEFSSRTSNLQIGDMDVWWLMREGIASKAALDAKLFGGSSNNGTFVIDANDRIRDRHSGGEPMLDAAATHLSAPKQIDIDLPQAYTAGPGNVLGNYTVRRTRKAGGGYELRKFGP